MNLPRHTLSSHSSPPVFVNAQFINVKEEGPIASTSSLRQDSSKNERQKGKARTSEIVEDASTRKDQKDRSRSMFACATRQGFFIAQTHPLDIVARRGELQKSSSMRHRD